MYYSTFGLEQLIESRMVEVNNERNLIRESRKQNPLGLRINLKRLRRTKQTVQSK